MSSTTKKAKKFTNALDAKATMNQITGGLSGGFEKFHIAGKDVKQGDNPMIAMPLAQSIIHMIATC